jgi:serine/threonine-protein kinase
VVPNVRGSTLAKARARIRKADCRVGKVTKAFSSARRRGRVVAEKPKPGTTLPGGARIDLTLGKGPRTSRGR